ncbi:MAG: ATP-binding protein [Bdellovibrionales bacterium]|nr:ATP-binding protein [Bdellovibrionales bacterium]
MWIDREISSKLLGLSKSAKVILLTGPRQTGKSSLLKNSFPKVQYISLDKPSTAYRAEHSGEDFLRELPSPVIIDEVQNAPSLFRHIKFFVDQYKNKKFFLTGSQNFTLMAQVSESLAGRVALLDLHSLSLLELKNHFNFKLNQKKLIELMFKGGYPEVWSKNLNIDEFFSNYVSTYIQKDIRQIINVKNLYDFERFMSLLASRVAQLLNYNKMASDIGVSSVTIKSWVNALEASNVLFVLKPFYRNLGKRLVKSPKVYFTDSGLLCHLIGFRQRDELKDSSLLGSLFENFVLGQILRAAGNKGKKANLFFYRDQWGHELDFIQPVGEKFHLYECKWNANPNVNLKIFSEIESLVGKKNILSKNIFSSVTESYSNKNVRVISLNDEKLI